MAKTTLSHGSAATRAPPGLALSDSEPESQTRARARRRMQAAVKSAMLEVSHGILDRIERLEAIVTCSNPSVDEVISELLEKPRAQASAGGAPGGGVAAPTVRPATDIRHLIAQHELELAALREELKRSRHEEGDDTVDVGDEVQPEAEAELPGDACVYSGREQAATQTTADKKVFVDSHVQACCAAACAATQSGSPMARSSDQGVQAVATQGRGKSGPKTRALDEASVPTEQGVYQQLLALEADSKALGRGQTVPCLEWCAALHKCRQAILVLAAGTKVGGWNDDLRKHDFADPWAKVKDMWDALDSAANDLGVYVGHEASDWPDLIYID